MRIDVTRFLSDRDATLSNIAVEGRFLCFGLEDEYREEKLVGETRIPAGRYNIAVRRHGGFHARYSARFSEFHRGMLEVMNVPRFTDILIHVGNTDQDTSGCLLVGMSATARLGDLSIHSSREAYRLLYQRVIVSAELGELEIQFIDHD